MRSTRRRRGSQGVGSWALRSLGLVTALLVLPALPAQSGSTPPTKAGTQSDTQSGLGTGAMKRTVRSAAFGRDVWTERVETATDKGLQWLAARQHPKGFWGATVGHKRGERYETLLSEEDQVAAGSGHVGVSALCGMAFLAGGHLPRRGKYGKVVQKVTDYILSRVTEKGIITDSGTQMYSHAFATMYLAEVYGMSRDPRIKDGLQKAVQIIVDSQNELGGWRYNAFTREADLSVTVCQLQSLRAARNIGIKVPRSTVERAAKYVRKSRAYDGHYYYKISGRGRKRKKNQYSIQAAAVTSLVSVGVYERELWEPALKFLEEEMGQVMQWYPHHFFFWYGNYYASQAFFHAESLLERRCFQRYYRVMREHLLQDQESDGRWLNDVGPGDAFSTSVACILLQIPKQYLPIFQR